MSGAGNANALKDFLGNSDFTLKRCGPQSISFSTTQYYYSFWGARGAYTFEIEAVEG